MRAAIVMRSYSVCAPSAVERSRSLKRTTFVASSPTWLGAASAVADQPSNARVVRARAERDAVFIEPPWHLTDCLRNIALPSLDPARSITTVGAQHDALVTH